MSHTKEFEISLPKAVYFGTWQMDGNKIMLDEVYTFDEDENKIEIDSINDRELYLRIYEKVEDEYSDEIEAELEQQEENMKWEKAERSWEATHGK